MGLDEFNDGREYQRLGDQIQNISISAICEPKSFEGKVLQLAHYILKVRIEAYTKIAAKYGLLESALTSARVTAAISARESLEVRLREEGKRIKDSI